MLSRNYSLLSICLIIFLVNPHFINVDSTSLDKTLIGVEIGEIFEYEIEETNWKLPLSLMGIEFDEILDNLITVEIYGFEEGLPDSVVIAVQDSNLRLERIKMNVLDSLIIYTDWEYWEQTQIAYVENEPGHEYEIGSNYFRITRISSFEINESEPVNRGEPVPIETIDVATETIYDLENGVVGVSSTVVEYNYQNSSNFETQLRFNRIDFQPQDKFQAGSIYSDWSISFLLGVILIIWIGGLILTVYTKYQAKRVLETYPHENTSQKKYKES